MRNISKTLLLLLCLCLLCSCAQKPLIDQNIMHGGGEIYTYTTTNSLEALYHANAAGYRFIELDFCLTSDGEPVCIHDWNEGYLPGYEKADFPLSLEQFSASRIYGELTPLTLDGLLAWLREHPDTYIITDIKDSNLSTLSEIAQRDPDLATHFIPQIYAENELEPVRAMGYEQVIYTIYNLTWEEKLDTASIAAFAKENKLTGITFPYELTQREGYVDALLEAGIPLYTHTLNDPELIAGQLDMGITAVYTDIH